METKIKFGKINGVDITWTRMNDLQRYVSDQGLFVKKLHEEMLPKGKIKWMDTDLNHWLDTEFANLISVSEKDRQNIQVVTLMTEGEVRDHFPTSQDRLLKGIDNGDRPIIWWLRPTCDIKDIEGKYVFDDGEIYNDAPLISDGIWVRPVITFGNSLLIEQYKI
ncbi:MAG: hypothetical protein ACI4S2_05915 [Lachnospiraceae bacterium]